MTKSMFQIVLITVICCATQAAAATNADIVGFWMTKNDEAKIEIFSCGDEICGKIAWTPKPYHENGEPKLDVRNRDNSLRGRPILGLRLMNGFKLSGSNKWTGGTIYSARKGKTHSVMLRLLHPDRLKIGKKILGIMVGDTWRRAE